MNEPYLSNWDDHKFTAMEFPAYLRTGTNQFLSNIPLNHKNSQSYR